MAYVDEVDLWAEQGRTLLGTIEVNCEGDAFDLCADAIFTAMQNTMYVDEDGQKHPILDPDFDLTALVVEDTEYSGNKLDICINNGDCVPIWSLELLD